MPPDTPSDPVALPIVLSSTFAFENSGDLAAAVQGGKPHLYTRWSNPTCQALEERVAAMEGADWSIGCSSGMAAITLALLSGQNRGGTLLVQQPVYGGTHELVTDILPGFGMEIQRVDLEDLEDAAGALVPGSSIFLETPANPTIRLVDVAAIRKAAPEGTVISVDATFATPVNYRPMEHGADLVVHSATKYLGGHHDVIAGIISGRSELYERIWNLRKLLGPTLDPSAAYRVWRGLETLELRVRKQNENARLLAERLKDHPNVRRVHHPALGSHPDHELYTRLDLEVGGVFSFELKCYEEAVEFADNLKLFRNAASLGGTHSLITLPAGVTHAGLSEDERVASGIPGGLLRLSVGLENPDSLWADIVQAMERLVWSSSLDGK